MKNGPSATAEFRRVFAERHTITDVTGSAPYALYEPAAQGLSDGDPVTTITDGIGSLDLTDFGADPSGDDSTYDVGSNGAGLFTVHDRFLNYAGAPSGNFSFVVTIDPQGLQSDHINALCEIGDLRIFSGGAFNVAHLVTEVISTNTQTEFPAFPISPDEFRGKIVLSVTVSISGGTGTIKGWLNGRSLGTVTTAMSAAAGGNILLGGVNYGFEAIWRGRIGTFVIWNAALTDAQRTRAEAIIGYQDKAWDQVRIIVDGNSIFYGTGLPDDQPPYPPSDAIPQQLRDLLGERYEVMNIGVGGQDTEDMLNDFETQVSGRLLHRFASYQIVVAMEGGNQQAHGSNNQEAYDFIREYCLKARATGALVIVGTQMLTADGADRVGYNELIRAHWREFADDLADFVADPIIGPYSAHDDPSIFIHDGPGDPPTTSPHLTAYGCGIAAGVVRDAIARLGFI